jgi:hypothetical protein
MRRVPAKTFTETVFKDSFDSNIRNWQFFKRQQTGRNIMTFTAKTGTSGSGALVLDSGNGTESTAEKYFTVTAPGDFMLTTDYFCENLQSAAIPYVSAEWCNAKGEILHPVYYSDTHGKNGKNWQKIVLKFTSPGTLPARLRIRLNLCRTKTGKVIFDNVILKSSVKNILTAEKKK